MKQEFEGLLEDILDEEKSIDETIKRLLEIKEGLDINKKDYTIEPAIGTYLMNFYNGIENILKRISRKYYLNMPKGENWHKELLILSYNPPERKTPILNEDLVSRLHSYRNFRHRFVSGYGFLLKGEKMLELVDNIESLWNDIKKVLYEFFDKL